MSQRGYEITIYEIELQKSNFKFYFLQNQNKYWLLHKNQANFG